MEDLEIKTKLSEKYGFPIAFIDMYRITMNNHTMYIRDGESTIFINIKDFVIEETDTLFILLKEDVAIELLKATIEINTFI